MTWGPTERCPGCDNLRVECECYPGGTFGPKKSKDDPNAPRKGKGEL